MPTVEAEVATERASRYLVQLCRHAGRMGQHVRRRPHAHDDGAAPPEVRHVEWSDTYGIVRLSWGQWTVQATPGALRLRVEAADEDHLRRVQDLVASRLERIGRRDHLTVTWRRTERPGDPPDDQPPPNQETHMSDPLRYPVGDTPDGLDHASTSGTPRWMVVTGVCLAIALVVLVGVLHLTGVLGPGTN